MVTTAPTTGSNNVAGGISALAGGNATKDVNFDTFLKLLVTQLQNQDPLNPMEGTEFTGQIAQFSQLEQQIAGNSFLEDLASARNFSEQGVAVSYIGKDVLAPNSLDFVKVAQADVPFKEGDIVEFAYELQETADQSIIEIRDKDDNLIRSFSGEKTKGVHSVKWDGTDGDGNAVADGDYEVSISAADEDGGLISNRVYTYRTVKEVAGDDKGLILTFTNDEQALFDQALSVRAGSEG